MGKFILIAFGFLGFAFYELSGGDDFDAKALRLSRIESGPIKQGLPKVTATTANAATDEDIAELVEVEKLSDPAVTVRAQDAIETPTERADVTQAAFSPLTVEEPASSIILPSLIAPSQTTFSLQDAQAGTAGDLRFVTGNRVNVRGGPGTDFDVVGSLTRGSEVLVLAENGEGWVEMQSLDGATIGWMADFLLEKG